MTAKIIDGKEVAAQIYAELKDDITELKEKYDVIPGIAVVLVGDNPASQVYVRSKKKKCEQLGIISEEHNLPETTTTPELLKLIEKINRNPRIHGILVQLPLPKGIDAPEVLKAISPFKDVDGFHPENVGHLLIGEPRFIACTPLGIQQLLMRSGIDVAGRRVVIVGRSNIVGKPLAALLVQKKEGANATVTVCHSRSKDLTKIIKEGEVVIVAIGKAEFLKGEMIKEGAVVIDVGTNRVPEAQSPRGYRLAGDVHFPSVSEKAGYITKVPGGVGPMTIAMLMYNTVRAAEAAVGKSKVKV